MNTLNKANKFVFGPFTLKIADLHKNVRVKGAEKQARSLRNGLENQAVSLPNTNIINFGTVAET